MTGAGLPLNYNGERQRKVPSAPGRRVFLGGAPTALPIREAGGHPVGACCRVLLALRAAKRRDIHAKHHMVIYRTTSVKKEAETPQTTTRRNDHHLQRDTRHHSERQLTRCTSQRASRILHDPPSTTSSIRWRARQRPHRIRHPKDDTPSASPAVLLVTLRLTESRGMWREA